MKKFSMVKTIAGVLALAAMSLFATACVQPGGGAGGAGNTVNYDPITLSQYYILFDSGSFDGETLEDNVTVMSVKSPYVYNFVHNSKKIELTFDKDIKGEKYNEDTGTYEPYVQKNNTWILRDDAYSGNGVVLAGTYDGEPMIYGVYGGDESGTKDIEMEMQLQTNPAGVAKYSKEIKMTLVTVDNEKIQSPVTFSFTLTPEIKNYLGVQPFPCVKAEIKNMPDPAKAKEQLFAKDNGGNTTPGGDTPSEENPGNNTGNETASLPKLKNSDCISGKWVNKDGDVYYFLEEGYSLDESRMKKKEDALEKITDNVYVKAISEKEGYLVSSKDDKWGGLYYNVEEDGLSAKINAFSHTEEKLEDLISYIDENPNNNARETIYAIGKKNADGMSYLSSSDFIYGKIYLYQNSPMGTTSLNYYCLEKGLITYGNNSYDYKGPVLFEEISSEEGKQEGYLFYKTKNIMSKDNWVGLHYVYSENKDNTDWFKVNLIISWDPNNSPYQSIAAVKKAETELYEQFTTSMRKANEYGE